MILTAPRHLCALFVLAAASSAAAQANHKIVNSFANPHGTDYAMGVAFARGELWLSSGLGSRVIHRVNAYTGASLGTIPAPTASLRGLTHDGTFLWAASWSDRMVYQMVDATGAVLSSFPAFTGTSGRPDGVAWDGGLLLISDENNQIHWFTPTGTHVRSITVPTSGSSNPRDLGWDGTAIWAGYQSSGRLRKHDPVTGAVLLDLPSPSLTFQQGVEWADGYLWTTGGTNATVYQIDAEAPYLELAGTFTTSAPVHFRVTDAQAHVGNLAVVLLSLSPPTPVSIGGFRLLLTFDPLTQLSLQALPLFSATVDPMGLAQTPPFNVPPIAAGVQFWAAGVTLSGSTITAVTDPIRFVSQ